MQKLRTNWHSLSIGKIEAPAGAIIQAGDKVSVAAHVDMDGLAPDEIAVELFHGRITSTGEIDQGRRVQMSPSGKDHGATVYATEVVCSQTGRQGLAVRILPRHPGLVNPMLLGLIKWA